MHPLGPKTVSPNIKGGCKQHSNLFNMFDRSCALSMQTREAGFDSLRKSRASSPKRIDDFKILLGSASSLLCWNGRLYFSKSVKQH